MSNHPHRRPAWPGALLMLLAATWTCAQDALSPEQMLIQELYGAGIARVRATRDLADDVALAEQLLTAANDAANPPGLRQALATEAMKLVLAQGTDVSTRVATSALAAMDAAGPLPPLERANYRRTIALNRLARANTERLDPPVRTAIAREAVEASVAHTDALGPDADPRDVRAELMRAQSLADQLKLADLSESIAERLHRHNAALNLQTQFAVLDKAIETALAAGNQQAAQTARVKLAMLHIQLRFDLPAAVEQLRQAAHPQAPALAAAVKFRDTSGAVAIAELLPGAEGVIVLCDALTEGPREELARLGLRMIEAFIAGGSAGLDAARANLLRNRLQVLAKETETDKFLAALKSAYNRPEGRLTVLDAKAGRVRLEYSFDDARQLRDFELSSEDKWGVVQNVLAGQSPSAIRAAHRVVFDAAKPLSVSFRCSGPSNLDVMLLWANTLPWPAQEPTPFLASLGYQSTYTSILFIPYSPVGRSYNYASFRVNRGVIYRQHLAWDGQDKLTWTVDNKELAVGQSRLNNRPKFMRVAFQVIGGPTAYDDVVIEGTVILTPGTAPPAATTPAAGAPGASSPGVRRTGIP